MTWDESIGIGVHAVSWSVATGKRSKEEKEEKQGETGDVSR
jgi:hypothetical protein